MELVEAKHTQIDGQAAVRWVMRGGSRHTLDAALHCI